MTTVRFFHNGTAGVGGMTGAPNLSGTAGSLIAVLDACLVDGWGAGTVDSVVISGGIATVTRAAGHPFDVDCVAEIAGATVTGGTIDGPQKVLTTSGTTYTFATALANQTATGTITHKVASLGWAKSFSGTNLAAYRSADVAGTRMYLRVDDTAAQSARVIGYESMSGISTGTGLFPTTNQINGGGFWQKSNASDSANRDWVLVGDSRAFFLWVRNQYGSSSAFSVVGFGDYQSLKSGDAFNCFLSVAQVAYPATNFTDLSCNSSGSLNLVQSRGVSGLGGSSLLAKFAASPAGQVSEGTTSGTQGMLFPNPADNGVYVVQFTLAEETPVRCFRGTLPGLWYCAMAVGSGVFSPRDRLLGVTGLSGRVLRNIGSRSETPFFIDVTGPWAR